MIAIMYKFWHLQSIVSHFSILSELFYLSELLYLSAAESGMQVISPFIHDRVLLSRLQDLPGSSHNHRKGNLKGISPSYMLHVSGMHSGEITKSNSCFKKACVSNVINGYLVKKGPAAPNLEM